MTPIPRTIIEQLKNDFHNTGGFSPQVVQLLTEHVQAAYEAANPGAGASINWAQLIQMVLQILSQLFPAPKPTP